MATGPTLEIVFLPLVSCRLMIISKIMRDESTGINWKHTRGGIENGRNVCGVLENDSSLENVPRKDRMRNTRSRKKERKKERRWNTSQIFENQTRGVRTTSVLLPCYRPAYVLFPLWGLKSVAFYTPGGLWGINQQANFRRRDWLIGEQRGRSFEWKVIGGIVMMDDMVCRKKCHILRSPYSGKR